MTLSVYDIPVNGSFRILNVKDKTELFCSDPVYGDMWLWQCTQPMMN